MKTTSCNEHPHYAFDLAPRCGAKTKRNNGQPCRAPAVRNKKRCRIHGGATGSGGQTNNTNALKHGLTTARIKNLRKTLKQAVCDGERLIADINKLYDNH